MFDDNTSIKDFIVDILNPTSEDIDHDKLEQFLLGFVDKMERNNKPIDDDTKKIIGFCCKLWREKESWKNMYYGLYERYNKHLDNTIAKLKQWAKGY